MRNPPFPLFILKCSAGLSSQRGAPCHRVGANSDPDVFALVFSSKRIPPNGSNRGRYRSLKVDELTDAIRVEMNQQKRKERTSQVQKIVAEDLPIFPSGTPT